MLSDEWMTDLQINSIVAVFNAKLADSTKVKPAVLIQDSLVRAPSVQEKVCQKMEVKQSFAVIFPCCYKDHWVVVHADFQRRYFQVFNSLSSRSTTLNIERVVYEFLSEIRKDIPPNTWT
ncbi:hypothetical protein F5141DRAFT_1216171 [Pisolithus sp. B1]|nr:hypothetical protein F5141DRAFT_1216171 [Pisolithus sp. B1]